MSLATMKVCSIVLLIVTLVSLPTCNGQNGQCSLCVDGSDPPNENATVPVPGLGSLPCSQVAELLGSLSAAQCTRAQAAGYWICGCPTAPGPNLDLPCAFCEDGTTPTNLGDVVTLPDSSSASCQDLMARASLLDDAGMCADIIEAASSPCGCPAAVSDEMTTPSMMPSMFSSSAETNAETNAESIFETAAETAAETNAETTSEPSEPTQSSATSEPTSELAMSIAHCKFRAHLLVGSTLIGVVAALV